MKFVIPFLLILFLFCNCSPKMSVKQQILYDQDGNITYCIKYIFVRDYPKLIFRDTVSDIRYSLDSTEKIITAYSKQGDTLWKLNPFKVLTDEGWIDTIHYNPSKIRNVRFLVEKPRLKYPKEIPVLYVGSYGH